MSGPPSVRANMSDAGQDDDIHGHMMHDGEELSGKCRRCMLFIFTIIYLLRYL
jgi:hypothetical protein